MKSRRLSRIRERAVDALRRLREEMGCELYLFGSYAKGTHTLDSDVDVLVISKSFEGLRQPERVSRVRQRLPEDMSFEIIALTPEEFRRLRDRAFYKEISKYWLTI